LGCGFREIYVRRQDSRDAPGKLSGNDDGFGRTVHGKLGLFRVDRTNDLAKRKRGLNSEFVNGCLAMVAIMGMMFPGRRDGQYRAKDGGARCRLGEQARGAGAGGLL